MQRRACTASTACTNGLLKRPGSPDRLETERQISRHPKPRRNPAQSHARTTAGPSARAGFANTKGSLERLGGYSEGQSTRSHSELGRENPQRPWYCVPRRGRVGRRQVFQANQNTRNTPKKPYPPTDTTTKHRSSSAAGWSSPVARQAHNLKVTGSNPVPASRCARQPSRPAGVVVFAPPASFASASVPRLYSGPCITVRRSGMQRA